MEPSLPPPSLSSAPAAFAACRQESHAHAGPLALPKYSTDSAAANMMWSDVHQRSFAFLDFTMHRFFTT